MPFRANAAALYSDLTVRSAANFEVNARSAALIVERELNNSTKTAAMYLPHLSTTTSALGCAAWCGQLHASRCMQHGIRTLTTMCLTSWPLRMWSMSQVMPWPRRTSILRMRCMQHLHSQGESSGCCACRLNDYVWMCARTAIQLCMRQFMFRQARSHIPHCAC